MLPEELSLVMLYSCNAASFAWNKVLKLSCLPEIAALLAAHGQSFVEQWSPLPVQVIGDYYVLSRNRFNRWMRVLDDLDRGCVPADADFRYSSLGRLPCMRIVAEQVLVNEILTRVWSLLLVAQDRFRGENDTEALASNVFLGHQAVRRRAMDVFRSDDVLGLEHVLRIEHIRREAEMWSDILCAPLMKRYELWSYAHDAEQSREFYRQRVDRNALSPGSDSWGAMLSSMRESFSEVDGLGVLVHEDDRRLVSLMLGSFGGGTNLSSKSGVATVKERGR